MCWVAAVDCVGRLLSGWADADTHIPPEVATGPEVAVEGSAPDVSQSGSEACDMDVDRTPPESVLPRADVRLCVNVCSPPIRLQVLPLSLLIAL